MIKWIKSLWGKLFRKKEETVKPIVLKPEPLRCYTHKRYKKSCPTCVAAAGNS